MNAINRGYLKHYAMLVPFFAFFLVFFVVPIVSTVILSFTRWDGIRRPEFVSLRHYANLASDPKFHRGAANIGLFLLIVIPVGITASIVLAMLVNDLKMRGADVFRGIYFFPVVIPLFLSASIFRYIFNPQVGIVDLLFNALSIPRIGWLTTPPFTVVSVAIVDMWRAIAFNFLFLYAGIQGVPNEYYEAARIDGASLLQQKWYVTLPQLEPIIFLVIVNGFIGGLQVFDIPWLISHSQYANYGGPSGGMLFPVVEIVASAWGRQEFGSASAYAVVLLIVALVVTGVQFGIRSARHYDD